MTIECYYTKCEFHSNDGPFCYEENCQASKEQIIVFQEQRRAELAQLVEHRPYKAEVVRSSRTLSTKVLDKMLLGMLGSKNVVEAWWNSPNKAFGMKTPRDTPLEQVCSYIKYYYTK